MIKYLFIFGFTILAQGCEININKDLSDLQPLLLKPSTNPEYYLPDNYGILYVPPRQSIHFNCPGGTIIVGGTDTDVAAILGICVGAGKTFTIEGFGDASFETILCSVRPAQTARYTGEPCLTNYKQVEIGFDLPDARFLRDIEICFDDVEQHTRYSKFVLSHFIGGNQVGNPVTNFLEGEGFYNLSGLKLDNLYSRITQRIVINTLVGLPTDSTKYINDANESYLAKGHLTSNHDLIYRAQHRLTFYYVNVAPQWQILNVGNWKSLEESLQKFAATRPNDLEVYTGSFGKATLPHEVTGDAITLVLFRDQNGKIAIPVPAVFWKVIYDPISKQGLALVGLNNPYQVFLTKICKDVCKEVTFLTWTPEDVNSGFSYCCAVSDLRKVIKDVPELDITSLLT